MTQTNRRLTHLVLAKEYMKFSAAHFTIFSVTERERLHGHNFQVSLELTLPVGNDGLSHSYRLFKDQARALCETLDEYCLLPNHSPYLDIHQNNNEYHVKFHNETLRFPVSDTLLLPIKNTSVEELSFYLLEQIIRALPPVKYGIEHVTVSVSSGAGQSGSSSWKKEE
ncbi:6-pyruvoyl tetrahydropterin synthase [Parashewanella curva]|uniref:6-carboxy-5,6,7,8-tetrahydropterin synthase n=1 Tax=Parashewanella curva TaxID=2338552 RepID=A0A3L8PWI9_9GAMM|nr:6-carboxytetrahydropterin synthase [Parashewanella curva]RLV59715.1 6-pyruvoyl tetrahydropterin synthase [Parashewanella curva]